MWIIQTKDTGRIYLVTSGGALWLGSPNTVRLLQRLIEHHGGNKSPIVMYQQEVDAINSSIKTAGASEVDTKAIAKGIADSIRPDIAKAIEGIDVQVGASAGEIADEIAKRLAA